MKEHECRRGGKGRRKKPRHHRKTRKERLGGSRACRIEKSRRKNKPHHPCDCDCPTPTVPIQRDDTLTLQQETTETLIQVMKEKEGV